MHVWFSRSPKSAFFAVPFVISPHLAYRVSHTKKISLGGSCGCCYIFTGWFTQRRLTQKLWRSCCSTLHSETILKGSLFGTNIRFAYFDQASLISFVCKIQFVYRCDKKLSPTKILEEFYLLSSDNFVGSKSVVHKISYTLKRISLYERWVWLPLPLSPTTTM